MAWLRVGLVVDGAFAEALAEALADHGAVSTEIADADAGTPTEQPAFGEPGAAAATWPRARVGALFEEGADAARAVVRALTDCGTHALEAASIDRLEDADWVASTQRQFGPIRAGERLWIVPTWHQPPEPEAINILLDPGAAFGTGSHPTTRLCLQWLERHVRPGQRVLDYGCGSGILAIAAMKLGAGAATGVDVDPLALETARYNALRNGVTLELADAHLALTHQAHITVANILANPLRMLAPLLAAHTLPRGSIAVSGILQAQATEVIAAYAPHADLAIASTEGDWILLAGQRHA